MIKQVLTYVADELKLITGLNKGEVTLENFLSIREKKTSGIIISLLNLEEEPRLKNSSGGPGTMSNSELILSLNIVVVFIFEDYNKGLEHLSSVAGYLHKKPQFTKEGALQKNPFPPGLSPFFLNWWSIDINQLNQIFISNATLFNPLPPLCSSGEY